MDSVYSFTTKLIAKHNNDIDEFIKCEIYKALGSEKRVYTFNDKLIIEAVEKAIPQKPVLQECDFFNVRLVCPKCKNLLLMCGTNQNISQISAIIVERLLIGKMRWKNATD